MSNNTALLTGSIREQYIAQRFELNDGHESTADVNNLSEEFMKSRLDFAAWYDSKSEEYQLLIDAISERTHFIIDEDEYDAFIEELANYGINDAEQFEDAFRDEVEGYSERVYAEFAENFLEDYVDDSLPSFIKSNIDWERVWYSDLQHDFTSLEFQGNTYFFYRHF